ncbi:MAG: hypothetical protein ACLR6J_13370 [Parabacteroides merdae]
MPGEIVSCVGCHEDQNSIPIPKRTIASTKQARRLETPEGGVRPFTFRLEVQPALDRNRVSCHNGKNAEPDFRKDQMVTYKRGILIENQQAVRPELSEPAPVRVTARDRNQTSMSRRPRFHASNSELIRILQAEHHGVEVPEEDMRDASMPDRSQRALLWGLHPNRPEASTSQRSGGTPYELSRRNTAVYGLTGKKRLPTTPTG